MRMNRFKLILLAAIGGAGLTVQSCKQRSAEAANASRFTSDSSAFVVDESLKPTVDEELYIFKALDSTVHPRIIYAPENEAVNLLLEDSVRVALLARDLYPDEYKVLGTRNLRPVVGRFAIGAVALIVNKASPDTTITLSKLKGLLNGTLPAKMNIVFDNPNSGLVRYLKQFSGSQNLNRKNIYSLQSNKEVIKYVSNHPDALGIVSFSWLNDPDKDYADAVRNVKIVAVKDDTGKNPSNQFYTPSQNTLALKQYPLVRNLYIINCTGNFSLGKKFADFIKGDRGQMIILKSGMLPDDVPPREIHIVTKLKQ